MMQMFKVVKKTSKKVDKIEIQVNSNEENSSGARIVRSIIFILNLIL